MDATTTARRLQRLPAAFQTGFATMPRATSALAAAEAHPIGIRPKQYAILPQPRPFPLAARRPRLPSALPGIARLPNKFHPCVRGPRHPKPTCSYPVLIGMALFNSGNAPLPVRDIYAFIERSFPFYKTSGPTGWKNSVRHSLSLGHYFRKAASHGAGAASKPKGNLWEIIPDKAEALRKEVDSFVASSIISIQQRLINGTNCVPYAGRPTLGVQPPPRLAAAFHPPLRATSTQLPAHNQLPLKCTPATDFPASYPSLQRHDSEISTTYPLSARSTQAYLGGTNQLSSTDPQVAPSLPTQRMVFADTPSNAGYHSGQVINDYGLCDPKVPLPQPNPLVTTTPQLSAPVSPPPALPLTDQFFNEHVLDGPLPPDLFASEQDLDFLKNVDIIQYLESDSLLGDETFEDFFLSTVTERPQDKVTRSELDRPSDQTDSGGDIDLESLLQELNKTGDIPTILTADPLPDFTLSASNAAQNSRKRRRQDDDDQPATADPLTLLVNTIIGKNFPESPTLKSVPPPHKKPKLA